jgi:hypothetical protein
MAAELDISDIETHDSNRTDFVRWKNGLPAVMLPDGSRREGYSRPSGAGKLLDDTTALDKWKLRTVLEGAAHNKSIIPAVSAALGITTKKERNKALNDLVDRAMDRGGDKDGADWGTALHLMTEQLDLGQRTFEDFPEEQRVRLVEYDECLKRYGLEPIEEYIECKIVHDGLHYAGTADRILRATKRLLVPCAPAIEPGDLVGCDVKTNSSDLDWSLLGYEIQSAIYFGEGATLYDVVEEVRVPMPDRLRHDVGFLIHLPSAGTGCDLVVLDLVRGMRGAILARSVKDWQKEKKSIEAPVIDPNPPEMLQSSEEDATVVDPMPTLTVDTTDLVAWIKDRIAALNGYDGAIRTLLASWPDDLPGLKAGGHTEEQLRQVDDLVAAVEARYGASFIPGPVVRQPRAEGSTIPTIPNTPYITVAEARAAEEIDVTVFVQASLPPTIDPNAPATEDAREAIRQRVARLTDEQRARVGRVKAAVANPMTLDGCSILTFERWRAMLAWIENGSTIAWSAAFEMLGHQLCDVSLLTCEDAQAMAELGQLFTEGHLVLSPDGTALVPPTPQGNQP